MKLLYSLKPAYSIFLFSLITSVFLTACHTGTGSDPSAQDITAQDSAQEDNRAFTEFCDRLFVTMACSDSLTLNYTISQPKNYGIEQLPNGFPSFSYEDLTTDGAAAENVLSALEEFDPDTLSEEQQVLYAVLHESLSADIEDAAFPAFSEALGPTTGIQAQLPVLLAEFRIDASTDLSQYFVLLKSIPGYFKSLTALEEEKNKLGTLPARSTLSHIIAQCEQFIEKSGTSILEETFEHKIQESSFLSSEKKDAAIKKNRRFVKRFVLPAYRTLIEDLKQLLPSAPNRGSLSQFPNGSDYYDCLIRRTTGSSLSAGELFTLMQQTLEQAQENLLSIAAKDPSLFSSCQRYTTSYNTPDKILPALISMTSQDFPSCGKTDYQIKYIDPSLEDYLSPAFYLTPPVDDASGNTIYINTADRYDTSSLFNTLAHEGFPGHLYQTCYMHHKNLSPLRQILSYGGYTEGWASYAEIYSYRYTGMSTDEIRILQNNMVVSLCLYGLCDLGVHDKGWDTDSLRSFLDQYGTWDTDTASRLYETIVDEPASYLKYSVGYLEMLRLKAEMKKLLGEQYTDLLFHTYVLDMGPASFDVLHRFLPSWCTKNGV